MLGLSTPLSNFLALTGLVLGVYALLWITYWFIGQLMKKKVLPNTAKDRNQLKTIRSLCGRGVVAIYGVIIVLNFLFLTTPFVREDVKTIPDATVDESFVPPTRAEIDDMNLVLERGDAERTEKVTEENTEAMEDAIELFDSVEFDRETMP